MPGREIPPSHIARNTAQNLSNVRAKAALAQSQASQRSAPHVHARANRTRAGSHRIKLCLDRHCQTWHALRAVLGALDGDREIRDRRNRRRAVWRVAKHNCDPRVGLVDRDAYEQVCRVDITGHFEEKSAIASLPTSRCRAEPRSSSTRLCAALVESRRREPDVIGGGVTYRLGNQEKSRPETTDPAQGS
jgi:hypothetical protein